MTYRAFLASTVALALTASSAAAQILPGSRLTFNGVANATDVGSAGVVLDFWADVLVDRAGNTGTFATLNRLSGPEASGHIQRITVGTGPQALANLLTVGGYRFDLQALPSGVFAQESCYIYPDVGQQCTPYQSPSFALSPFYLTNAYSGDPDAPLNSIASFDLIGTVSGIDGRRSMFFGTISSMFSGLSYQEALSGLEQNGLSGVPFQGVFIAGAAVTATPEPGTYVLVATGLLGVVAMRRRRQR